MTEQERRLWFCFLKEQTFTVKRQYVVGNYIADFYIPSVKIVVELDGGGHYEEGQEEYDKKRNRYMESCGFTVLRYSNADVNTNFEGVCVDILNKYNKLKNRISAF